MNSASSDGTDKHNYTSEQEIALARVYEYLLRHVGDETARGGEKTGTEVQTPEVTANRNETTDEPMHQDTRTDESAAT